MFDQQSACIYAEYWVYIFHQKCNTGYDAKNSRMTSSGIEPATFLFVAQHLNHCATAVPI